MERVILKGPDFCAVVEDGRLMEYIRQDLSEQSGDILLGKIDRMMPNLNCAFVNIGRTKNGFLPLEENGKTFQEGKPKSGETMILQIRKEETGEKGAFLTRDITLAGTYVILMPKNRYIGVSSRIDDEETRERLKKLGQEIAENRFGMVMRHCAPEAEPDEIRTETEKLFDRWQEIEQSAESERKPGTVLRHCEAMEALREDYRVTDKITEIRELNADLKRQLVTAEGRRVQLPHGGNIVIDRCEAMTVIDVNTASSMPAGNREQLFLTTNLEACNEIMIQTRLRDLAGIILIDFIDMDSETDRSLILERLKECFKEDRIKTVLHGWTRLGLMEMTRKRR